MFPGRIFRGPTPAVLLLAVLVYGLLSVVATPPASAQEFSEELEGLPAGVDQARLEQLSGGKLRYDRDRKRLIWTGTMSEAERDTLVTASNSQSWRASMNALFTRAQARADVSGEGEVVTMNAQQMDISELLTTLARRYKLNIVVSKRVEGKVTMQIDNVTVKTAIDAILRSQGYTVQIIPNPAPNGREVWLVVEPSAPTINLTTKIIPVRRALASQVELEFKPLVDQLEKLKTSPQARIIANENARIIFVEDTAAGIQRIQDFVNAVVENLPERPAAPVQPTPARPTPSEQPEREQTPEIAKELLPVKKLYRVARDFDNIMEQLKKLVGVPPQIIDQRDGIIMIDAIPGVQEQVDAYLDMKASISGPGEPPIRERITTRVYTLKQKAEDVKGGLEPFLTEGKGRIVVNAQLNSLIITDLVLNFDIIERYIRELDAAPQQVLIETTILEASLDDGSDFGLSSFFTRGVGSGTVGYQGKGYNPGAVPAGASPFRAFSTPTYNFGFIISNEWEVALNALQTTLDANILSRPKLVVANNRRGIIKIGTEIPYVEAQGGAAGATQGVSFKPVDLTMQVTPHIEPGDRIRLELLLQVDANTGVANLAGVGSGTPIISTRSAQTEVYINDGETLVIGGLYEERQSSTVDKVPVLGDLPILGQLFRSTSLKKQKTDLLFIITPTIVRDRREVQITRDGRDLKVFRPERPQIPDWYDDINNSRLQGTNR